MTKTILLRILFIISITSVAGQAFGVPIVVSLDGPERVENERFFRVEKGRFFDVDINVTGLQSNGHELGAFSLDVSIFGTDVISLLPTPTIFGDELGDEDFFQVITGESRTGLGSNSTKLELFAVSLLFDFELATLQEGPDDIITLATLKFIAPDFPGEMDKSALIFADNFVLSDALGNQIMGDNTAYSAPIIVVPEPATLAIFSLGLIGVFSLRKQRWANQA